MRRHFAFILPLVLTIAIPGGAGAQAARDTVRRETHGDPARTTFAPELGIDLAKMERLSGVYVRDVEVGTGALAASGRTVTVGYIVYLPDGTEVERSDPKGPPVTFTIGGRQAIRGWDLGMRGMRVGGTRVLVVPARLAYGSEGTEKVPPQSVLVFVMSLDAIR